MLEWLKAQVCVDGVLNLAECYKLAAAAAVPVLGVWRLHSWFINRHAARHADLRIYRREVEGLHHVKIENLSDTATAEQVIVYFDDLPHYEHAASLDKEREVFDLPPRHAEVVKFMQPMIAYVQRVSIAWQDGAGKHHTPPTQLDALPEF